MSDIDLKFYGLIALLVFLIAVGGLAFVGSIGFVVALIKASKSGQAIRKQKAFAFFLAAMPLVVLNLAAFGILTYFIDSNSDETNQMLDTVTVYAWLPLQFIIWLVGGFIGNKL